MTSIDVGHMTMTPRRRRDGASTSEVTIDRVRVAVLAFFILAVPLSWMAIIACIRALF